MALLDVIGRIEEADPLENLTADLRQRFPDLLELSEDQAIRQLEEVERLPRRDVAALIAWWERMRLDETMLPPDVGLHLWAPIKAGGQGVVYEAKEVVVRRDAAVGEEQQEMTRRVAVKMILPTHRDDPVHRDLLWREYEVLTKLASDPGVVTPLRAGQLEDESPFFTMPIIGRKSPTLWHYFSDRTTQAPQRIEMVRRVCVILDRLHGKGYVHGDLSPANVLVTDDGVPILADFATAQERSFSPKPGWQRVFTPGYADPARRGVPTTVDDVISIGALLADAELGFLHSQSASLVSVWQRDAERLWDAAQDRLTAIRQPFLEELCRRCLDPERAPACASQIDEKLHEYQIRVVPFEQLEKLRRFGLIEFGVHFLLAAALTYAATLAPSSVLLRVLLGLSIAFLLLVAYRPMLEMMALRGPRMPEPGRPSGREPAGETSRTSTSIWRAHRVAGLTVFAASLLASWPEAFEVPRQFAHAILRAYPYHFLLTGMALAVMGGAFLKSFARLGLPWFVWGGATLIFQTRFPWPAEVPRVAWEPLAFGLQVWISVECFARRRRPSTGKLAQGR